MFRRAHLWGLVLACLPLTLSGAPQAADGPSNRLTLESVPRDGNRLRAAIVS